MSEAPAQRIVPGAPPPTSLTKNQKKRRKASSKVKPEDEETAPQTPEVSESLLVPVPEKAPSVADPKETLVVNDGHAQDSQAEDDFDLKSSPIIELINKRLKATTKKIARISIYASTDNEKLNEDQQRSVASLPALEAVQKELLEVKKAIAVHEAEIVHELSTKRSEVVKHERQRQAEALDESRVTHIRKSSEILEILRFQAALSDNRHHSVDLAEHESSAFHSMAESLMGGDEEAKNAVLANYFSEASDFQGVPYERLVEICNLYFNAPPQPSDQAAEAQLEQSESSERGATTAVPDTTSSSVAGSFHFMQASELENSTFEEGAEWVEKPDEATPSAEDANETNGQSQGAPEEKTPPPATKMWADEDEEGLPSIAGLQAQFSASGSATPAKDTFEEMAKGDEASHNPGANYGQSNDNERSDQRQLDSVADGFHLARPNRGRGRGDRGESRGDRGYHRGRSDRGGYRGERRGFRGEGGFRGDSGHRGGGGYQRGSGDWRGEGEHRGRGFRGGRGGDPEYRGRGRRGGGGDGEHRGTRGFRSDAGHHQEAREATA